MGKGKCCSGFGRESASLLPGSQHDWGPTGSLELHEKRSQKGPKYRRTLFGETLGPWRGE